EDRQDIGWELQQASQSLGYVDGVASGRGHIGGQARRRPISNTFGSFATRRGRSVSRNSWLAGSNRRGVGGHRAGHDGRAECRQRGRRSSGIGNGGSRCWRGGSRKIRREVGGQTRGTDRRRRRG